MEAGRMLLHYRLVEKIGEGAMGVVWKALDITLDRDVALKVLPEMICENSDRLARFEREAKLLASLSHPNIATLYALHEAEGLHFLTMELVAGEDMERRLQGGPLSVETALTLCEQIADALSVTHRHGVMHRDLKPANIVVTPEGKVKVLDFGLAKALESARPSADDSSAPTMSSAGTRAGVVLGTAAYMSPEQARGRPLDERTDVWSFGCILYEALTGRRAFSGETFSDSLAAVLTREPEWSALPPGLPAIVTDLLRRCLRKDSGERLADMGEASRDIRAALRGESRAAHPARPQPGEKSIAVLPFANRSADPENEYFSDGLSEELIHALARLPGLRVASRTSAFRYRGRDLDIRQIGRELNVETVLEGSVRRSGNRLRVTAQLINVADGYHLWSERYDRKMADVFDIQDDITEAIVKTVAPTLLGPERYARRRHTNNLEAYELYLKGRHFWHQRTASTIRAGIDCFQRAIELDPTYALAHAGLADSFAILRPYGFVSAEEGKSKSEAAAKKAMELDPTLAESHFAAALFHLYYGDDWLEAEPYFKKAIELDPSSALASIYYDFFLVHAHRFEEAIARLEDSTALDPLSPLVHAIAALTLYVARRYDDALRYAGKALELQSDFALALIVIGLASCMLGQYEMASEALERVVSITKRPAWFLGMLGYSYGVANRKEEASRLLDELEERSANEYIMPTAALLIQLGLGDRDKAYEQLEACVEDHTPPLTIEASAGPLLDDLVSEPRFVEIFHRLRLAPRTSS